MKLLIAAGAEVSAPDAMGSTAFHLFCGEGHLSIVQDLVAVSGAGGDLVGTKDGRGYLPIDWARGCGRKSVAAWLIRAAGRM